MKKALLSLVLALIMLFAACDAEQAANNTATDNSEELELYSYWETMYDGVMADWKPAQLFSTEEYTYGIDELSISQNDDGSYTISFIFGAAFNLFIGDYRVDSRLKLSGLYYPELYSGTDSEEGLTLQHWYPAGSGTTNTIIGPYLTYYEYLCDEKPQALYFKTPEFRIIDQHTELVVDDPSLYTIEYGEPYTYHGNTYTVVNFVLGEALNWEWTRAKLYVNDTEFESNFGRRDGIDFFRFEFPENISLDSGYTFTLSWEHLDIPRQVFEIDMD